LFFRIFIERYAKQVEQFFIQFNVVELRARKFDRVACAKNIEIFSIILQKIDIFLNLVENLSRSKLDFAQISDLLNFSKLLLFYRNIKINTYNRDYRLVFYQIKKKLYLTVFTTQEDLEYYQQSKNINSITILFFKYFEFLDIFSKKETNILLFYCFYNYAIYFKEDT